MSDPAIQDRFRRILGRVQQPARLVGQETGSGPGFSGRPDETRLVLGFPDTYEIGISNQAIQVLYHVARGVPGVGVERTYLPWVDVIAEMRNDSVPLLTLETWSAVSSSHLLAFTLQHEFNYTNLLEMLDLAGIPLLAAERAESEPLVIAGGPAAANFFPMAPFLDAVAVGEGEAMLVDILDCVGEGRQQGTGRGELKTSLSRIRGVFVPGVSETVRKRSLPRLEGAPYPSAPLVPLTAGVHDRAWVEVMRGCTRGCRFCQAGMWYRPVRERRPESVLALAGEVMAATGHQELAFGSLSTTDYSAIGELLDRTAQTYPEVKVSLPSLRVDSAAVRLARLVSPTGPSVTLAPEAGSQRMRDVINKNVSEEDILGAAEEAFRTGRTTLKLYFMIGLPTETDEDVLAIADLVVRLRDLGRRCLGSRSSRLQLNVSINNFVPKPFTPFQWSGMPARDVLQQRQALLRSRLRLPGVRVALHDIEKSYLEGALARGGEEMARAILGAWERGARFDSWTEQFKAQAWDEALTDAGITAEDLACKEYAHDDLLPWDRIRGVVGAEFLWSERLRALRGETTSDCRREGCQSCGACPAAPGNDLAEASAPPASSSAPVLRVPKGSAGEGPRGLGPRYLVTFSVSDRACFIGHLDKTEIFRRAVRRAGGRLALSEGMRPKALLTLVLPLAVGVCGRGEMCEFELAEEPPGGFIARLASSLPPGMQLVSSAPYHAARRAAGRVIGATYEVTVATDLAVGCAGERFTRAVRLFAEAPAVPVLVAKGDGVRSTDVKTFVDSLEVRPGEGNDRVVVFTARVSPSGTVRPETVTASLAVLGGFELDVTKIERTEILLS